MAVNLDVAKVTVKAPLGGIALDVAKVSVLTPPLSASLPVTLDVAGVSVVTPPLVTPSVVRMDVAKVSVKVPSGTAVVIQLAALKVVTPNISPLSDIVDERFAIGGVWVGSYTRHAIGGVWV